MIPAVLGIDLGTSSVKAALVEIDTGRLLAIAAAEYPTRFPGAGAAEQDPDDWWRAAIAAVSETRSRAGAGVAVDRIGITGQMHGTVLLDSACQPIGNAIIWSDIRSAADAEALMTEAGSEILRIAGSPVAAGFQAAAIRWLKRRFPPRWEKTRHVLLPKDFLRFRLTGRLATDPSDAAGTLLADRTTRDWSEPLLELSGVPREYLPAIQPSRNIAGVLLDAAADALGLEPGTPVVTGAADAAAAALGAGVTGERQLLITLSTGAQVLVPRATPDFDGRGRLHTFASALEPATASPGWYIMGATTVAGMALRWLRDTVFLDRGINAYHRIMERAATVPIGANGVLFLPHMTGERSPDLNPLARGAFIGLTPAHGQAELARAVLEGVVCSIYDAYQAVKDVVAQPAREIILAGGGARGPLWRSMIADLFDLPVRPLESTEQTAIGAAILAASDSTDPATIASAWVRYGAPVQPDARRHETHRALFNVYRQANRALNEVYGRLAALPGPTRDAQ